MKISLVAAVARNGVIGKDGKLPWYLPNDLRHFKRITDGHPVIMGRKTFQSILLALGKPLPGRMNIVLSRRGTFHREVKTRGLWFQSLSFTEALMFAATEPGSEEVFVIGGASVYEMAMPIADKMYLTEVEEDVEGDAVFPMFKPVHWSRRLVGRELAGAENQYTYSFVEYSRTRA